MCKDIYLIENLLEIEIDKDFHTVSKQCRESIYFLKSIDTLINTVLIPEKDKDCFEKMIKQYKDQVKMIVNEYNELDNLETCMINSQVKQELKVFRDNTHMIQFEYEDIADMLLKYIQIKSKSDKIQLEILNELIKVKIEICENLSANNEKLGLLMIEYKNQQLTNMVFNKSSDSDKILNIKFATKNKDVSREYKNHELFKNRYKIKDYTYNLKQARDSYSRWQDNMIELIKQEHYISEDNLREQREQKLFIYNKHVLILTYITVLLTIITVLGIDINKFIGTNNKEGYLQTINMFNVTTPQSISTLQK